MQTTTPALPKSAGLVSAPAPQNQQFSTNMSFPQANNTGSIARPTLQPLASTTPQIGGVGSGGTLNPNYTMSTPQAPVRGLFSDVVSSLASHGVDRNKQIADEAKAIGDKYAAKFEGLLPSTRSVAGHLTTGTLPIGEGNAQAISRAAQASAGIISDQQASEMAAINSALAAQGQAQSALGTAGGLTQPQVTGYGQTVFDPSTGQFAGGGGGGLPDNVMQQYAQMAATGQYNAIPTFITSNPILNAQLNDAARRINSSYTPVGSQGAGAVLAQIPALESANSAAEGIRHTITSYLSANPGLNPSNLAAGNLLQQWIQGKQLTDPKYQTLFNYLNEYTNTLAPILGVGGEPTNLKTQIAQGFINAAGSGQSIAEVLNNMSQLATDKIANMRSGAIGGNNVNNFGFAEAW